VTPFDCFRSSFRVAAIEDTPTEAWHDDRLLAAYGYEAFAGQFAGCTFDDGLYRVHDATTGPRSNRIVAEAFPAFASRACPFGFDWLGRQFAVDSDRREGTEPLVLMLEPGTGEALEIPLTFSDFHEELDDLREPALAETFFVAWKRAHPGSLPLKRSECVGYRIPLFLGGSDALDNLTVTDAEVYWELSAQLRKGSAALPEGASVDSIVVDPP
jgi:hypothetical protein